MHKQDCGLKRSLVPSRSNFGIPLGWLRPFIPPRASQIGNFIREGQEFVDTHISRSSTLRFSQEFPNKSRLFLATCAKHHDYIAVPCETTPCGHLRAKNVKLSRQLRGPLGITCWIFMELSGSSNRPNCGRLHFMVSTSNFGISAGKSSTMVFSSAIPASTSVYCPSGSQMEDSPP